MSAPLTQAALRLFDELAELPAEEREARLQGAVPEVATRVRRMLEIDQAPISGLGVSIGELAAQLLPQAPEPTHIGQYRILGRLGQGGMGVVWEAEQATPERRVALKTLHTAAPGPAMAQLEQEAQALARVLHPGIPQVYEVGNADGVAFVAMERVEGESLLTHADRRALGVRERVDLWTQACDAVAAAHLAGVLHRDLKPSNVLVSTSGVVKVLDFGLASVSPTLERAPGGTPAYASPEQVLGEPVDAQSDVYGLGAIGRELLGAGRRQATSWEEAREAASDPPRRPAAAEVDDDLWAVLLSALAPDPSLRPAGADALARELRRWLAHLPVRAREASLHHRARLLLRRNPNAVAASMAGALMVGLLALGGVAAVTVSNSWARQARERAASARLTALQPQLATLRAEHDLQQARALVREFANSAPNVHTQAAFQAWMDESTNARDTEGALDAAARAYADAPSPESARVALRRLSSLVVNRGDAAATSLLARLLPADPTDPVLASLHLHAAAADRKWLAAAERAPDLAPILSQWAFATSIPGRHPAGAPGGQLVAAFTDHGLWTVDLSQGNPLTLPLGRQIPYDLPSIANFHPFSAGSALVLENHGVPTWIDDAGDRALPVPTAEEVLTGGLADTDGDGRPERYVATGLYGRTLERLDDDGSLHPVHAGSTGSDIHAVSGVDLDQDGDDELVLTVGAWRHWDLRALTREADGSYRLLDRVSLGDVWGGVPIQLESGPGVVVAVNGPTAARARRGYIDAGAAVVYGWENGRWARRARIPTCASDVAISRCEPRFPFVGDFDGDGLEDFAVGGDSGMMVARQLHGERFASIRLPNLVFDAVAQLDDDRAMEPLVRLDGEELAWALGVGSSEIPPVKRPEHSFIDDPEERIRRAGVLRALGHVAVAADRLDGGVALDATIARRLRLDAARLRAEAGDDAGVLRALDSIAATDAEAAAIALPAALSAHRWSDAHRLATTGETRTLPLETLARLAEPAAAVTFVGRTHVHPAVELLEPAAMAVVVSEPGLRFTAVGNSPPLLRAPFAWNAPRHALQLEFLLRRPEFGATLRFQAGEVWAELSAWGGAGAGLWRLNCGAGNKRALHRIGVVPSTALVNSRVRLRVEYAPEVGSAFCRINVDAEPALTGQVHVQTTPPAQPQFEVRATADNDLHAATELWLTSVMIEGAGAEGGDPVPSLLAWQRALKSGTGAARAVALFDEGVLPNLGLLSAEDRRLALRVRTGLAAAPGAEAGFFEAWEANMAHHGGFLGVCVALDALPDGGEPLRTEADFQIAAGRARCASSRGQLSLVLQAWQRLAAHNHPELTEQAHLELARLAAMIGNEQEARAEVEAAAADSNSPELVWEAAEDDPWLRTLVPATPPHP